MNRLEGKVAIVTGGGSGIGEAIAKKFAREGAKVIVAGLPEDPVQAVAEEITQQGGRADFYKGDLSQRAQAEECVQLTVKLHGRLDILINNAGVYPETNYLQDFSDEAFDYLLTNNIKTVFQMTKAALPELQKAKGNIVTAGSESAIKGLPKATVYGGTKGWIHAFMKGLAVEQAHFGVRCNVVAPGPIHTAWNFTETGPVDKEMEKLNVMATPLGRMGTTEEVANVYLFLASDEASYVTGSVYSVDGGMIIGKGPVGEKADSSMTEEPKGELDIRHNMDGHTTIRRKETA